MASLFRKWLAGMTAGLLLIPGTWVYAATAEGEVLSVSPKGPGLWQIVVKGREEKQTYVLSLKTAIKKEIPVEEVRQGDHLMASPGGTQGTAGFKGIKGFGNMAPGAKKALGLPDVPNIPAIPKVPKIPSKAELQAGRSAAEGKGPAKAAEGGAPEKGAAPGAEKGRAPKEPEPKVKTQDDILEEKGFQNEKLLFPPGKEEAVHSGLEVLAVKKTDKGFEVTMAGDKGEKDKLMLESGKKVLKALTPEDLREKDQVRLEFQEQGKVVTDLLVKSVRTVPFPKVPG